MSELLMIGFAGFLASFVDGALGMGFGVTSSTVLLGAGMNPASVSTTVNLAKMVTGLAAGISHWRFRNIHPKLVLRLAASGAVGALLGVALLNVVSAVALKPILAALLSVVGLRILLRFARPMVAAAAIPEPERAAFPDIDVRGVELAGAAGGLTNGLIGAWGPVVTPALLHKNVPPRYAIGSANTAEVFVAAVSAVSLLGSLGSSNLDFGMVLAMLSGGVIAAPVAAYVIRYVPTRPMGIATAALLLFTNARELGSWAGGGSVPWLLYSVIGMLVIAASLAPRFLPSTAESGSSASR
jgi:uncharacterized membrane protein YfcA